MNYQNETKMGTFSASADIITTEFLLSFFVGGIMPYVYDKCGNIKKRGAYKTVSNTYLSFKERCII